VSGPVAIRVLTVVLCAALAVIAGLIAGILTFAGGTGLAGSFLAGGGALVIVLPVALTVAEKLGML
jgi:hypothetical protein